MVCIFGRSDLAARQSACEVNPAIDPQGWMTDAQLSAAVGGKPGEDYEANVGAPIAIGIFEIKQVGRAGDEQAALPGHEAIGESQSFGEDSALVQAPIAIGVLQ